VKTVWIYVDTSKQVGDKDHLRVFANLDAAETWFEENDPEGVRGCCCSRVTARATVTRFIFGLRQFS